LYKRLLIMTNTQIGENLRILRILKNYSQEGLANKLGKTQNWLQKIEKGEIDIPLSCLTELSRELEVSVDFIITFDKTQILNKEPITEQDKTLNEILQLLKK
jgi:transcriptional regulator with XRE-family HTH domain